MRARDCGANVQTSRGCPCTCIYRDYGRHQPYYEPGLINAPVA
ncbi:MAG: hypothetical protein V2A76_10520 [Planctomycetota bacterium]